MSLLTTTKEIAEALNLPHLSADDLYDIQDETLNYIGDIQLGKRSNEPHSNPEVNRYCEYLERRQLGQISKEEYGVVTQYKDGVPVKSYQNEKYFVTYENIVGEMAGKKQELLFPSETLPDNCFEQLLDGHCEFLYIKHPANEGRISVSNPRKHFSNWDEYPELHFHRVFAFA